MARTSVREYAVLYTGKGGRSSSGGSALGGNALLATPPHALDGLEHSAASDLTRLDASADAHGLLPKLSGAHDDALRGDGTWDALSVTDAVVAHGVMGASETVDVADGRWHYGTLDANCTIALTGAVAGELALLELELLEDVTGGWSPTWPGAVIWVNGVTPSHDTTAGSTTIYAFASRDGGTTWYGVATSGSALTVKDEGVALATPATSLDFVGAGVAASGTGAAKTITISGAPAGAAGGDLSGTYPNPSVVDDSHSHTASTLPVVAPTDHEHINDIQFNGDGATTAFELPAAPFDAFSVAAYVAGVRLDVTLSGTMLTTMTFGSAPAAGTGNIMVDLIAAAA